MTTRILVSAILVLLGLNTYAYGDGIYLSDRAFQEPPPIPHQRALIVHRAGIEQLIVESTVDTESQALGWLLPLPAAPSSMVVVSPGVLDSLDVFTQPRLIHDMHGVFIPVLYLSLLLLGGIFLVVFPKNAPPILLLILISLVLVVLLMPTVMHARKTPGRSISSLEEEITVLERSVVGNYDVTVLEANDGAILDRWLSVNGFASLPEQGRAIADDYCRSGWVFVASRLRREGTGLCTPHPLSLTFPAEQAIYPMRLTALSGTTLGLDLWVIAEQLAVVEGMTCGYADTFRYKGEECLWGQAWFLALEYPSLADLAWDSCVLTKLYCDLPVSGMKQDIAITYTEPSPRQEIRYSSHGAWMTILAYGIPIGLLLAFFGCLAVRLGTHYKRQLRPRFLGVALGVTILFVAFLPLVYLVLPVVPVRIVESVSWRHTDLVLIAILAQPLPEDRSLPGLKIHFESCCRKAGLENPMTGKPVRAAESPGNFQVESDGGRGFILHIFEHRGLVQSIPESEILERRNP